MIGRSRNGKESKTTTNQIDEFSEELEYIYFGDTGDESDDSETSDIDFTISNFKRTDYCRNWWLPEFTVASVSKMSEAYLEPAQAFKMVLWDYPFNTYTKVFEKLIFLTPYICVSGGKK